MLSGEADTSMMRTWRYNLTLVTVSTDGGAYAHLTLAVTIERAAPPALSRALTAGAAQASCDDGALRGARRAAQRLWGIIIRQR